MMQMGQMKALASSRPSVENNSVVMQPIGNGIVKPINEAQELNFTDLLSSAIKQVNGIQQEAGQLKKDFEMGKEGVDLVQVMVASEKSSVAFTSLLEVRNKLMKAYTEVKNIRV